MSILHDGDPQASALRGRAAPPGEDAPTSHPAVPSKQLLAGKPSVTIDHDGVRYTLRATRSGKLILTK